MHIFVIVCRLQTWWHTTCEATFLHLSSTCSSFPAYLIILRKSNQPEASAHTCQRNNVQRKPSTRMKSVKQQLSRKKRKNHGDLSASQEQIGLCVLKKELKNKKANARIA